MSTTESVINEISIQYKRQQFSERRITSAEDAERIAREVYAQTDSQINVKEYFFVLLLNRANRVVAYYKLSEGGLCGTVADVRLAFSVALKCLATNIIIVHNHPSGNWEPSDADKALTKKFRVVGDVMEIPVTDHIILTDVEFYSFAENGI